MQGAKEKDARDALAKRCISCFTLTLDIFRWWKVGPSKMRKETMDPARHKRIKGPPDPDGILSSS